jgi:hypothetical protein
MFKKLLLVMCVGMSFSAFAQQRTSLPVICTSPENVEKVLREHKEEILFVGKDTIHGIDQLTLNIFFNPKTGTYSAVLVARDASVICVISSGELGKIIHNN